MLTENTYLKSQLEFKEEEMKNLFLKISELQIKLMNSVKSRIPGEYI